MTFLQRSIFWITLVCAPSLSLAQTATPTQAQACYPGKLGINISLPERGGTFNDIVKEIGSWTDADGTALTVGERDASGWPAKDFYIFMDTRPVAEWSAQIDDPAQYRPNLSGVYKGSFSGSATVALDFSSGASVQNVLYDGPSNTTTFDLTINAPGVNHLMFQLRFSNTKRTSGSALGSGITDLRILRPGVSTLNPPTFTAPFLAALASGGFSTIRFMPFLDTNDEDPVYPGVTQWTDRKLPTDVTQDSWGNKLDGGSWEYVVELSNTTGMDPWINVPISANSAYVTQLAVHFRDNLNPSRHVYVESSNEVWNSGFPQQAYNAAQAAALGIPNPNAEHKNHARRTVEISNIFSSVFGASAINQRVRVVLCSHAPMLQWWVVPMLQYVNSNFGPPRNYIYAISRQTYFEPQALTGTETVNQLMDLADADIASQAGPDTVNNANRAQWANAAVTWMLPGGVTSYEGGPSFPSGGDTTNLANKILANRSVRMGDSMKRNLATYWWDQGCGLAMQFTISSGYNRYGCWGLTDDITNPDRNYKFQAMRDLVTCPVASPSPTPSATLAVTSTFTPSRTPTPSFSPTRTSTSTATTTSSPTSSATSSRTATLSTTSTFTVLPSSTPTPTSSITQTPSATASSTQSFSPTPSWTGTVPPASTPTYSPTLTRTLTVTLTATSTSTRTVTPDPSPTMTSSFTPSPTSTRTPSPTGTVPATATPTTTGTGTSPDEDRPYPNPWDGSQPLALFHDVAQGTSRITLKIYTLSYRLIYSVDLPTNPGIQLFTVDWAQLPDPANGLYYLVLLERSGSKETKKVMKLFIRR